MGVLIRSCWVCGKTMGAMGTTEPGEGPKTEWAVCEECKPRALRVSGESRVLPSEPIEKVKGSPPIVYVCSPFKGDIAANTEKAKNAAIKLAVEAADRGEEPPTIFVPHLAFQYTVDGRKGTELWRAWAMRMCRTMVGVCDEIVVCGGDITEGMMEEIEEAKWAGVKVTYREDLK